MAHSGRWGDGLNPIPQIVDLGFLVLNRLFEKLTQLYLLKPTKIQFPENLVLETCAPEVTENIWFRLWLADALNQYKQRIEGGTPESHDIAFDERVCQPKLTVTTQFQLLFDVSAGTNILQTVPILLPISGMNVDASPDYTHFLQIIFSLRPFGKFKSDGTPADLKTQQRVDACAALQATNPPASAR